MRAALDRASEVFSDRPWTVAGLLVFGVVFGVVLRGATADDATVVTQPTAGTPEEVEEPSGRGTKSDDTKSRKPREKPQPAPGAEGAARAIDEYQQSLNGVQVGAVILPLSGKGAFAGGALESGPPWSVMKVPAAAAYLNFRRDSKNASSGQATLTSNDLELALVQSDNLGIRRPVQEMIKAEGPERTAARINAMLDEGGASGIRISSQLDPSIDSLELGTGTWRLGEAAEWFRQLQVGAGCLGLTEDDRVYLLSLLEDAPSALPWGAAAALGAEDFALKPGWGASTAYTTEQLVIVGNGDAGEAYPSANDGYVMAIMAQVPGTAESSFEAGKKYLEEMAELISESMGVPSGTAGDLSGSC